MNKQINEELFNENYKLVSIHIGINDLRAELNKLNVSVLEVLKKPYELLQEILGEDYTIQPTFSNKHFTEYIVVDSGIEFSFQITNDDYNVFNVSANGTFFANPSCVRYWARFLDLCDQVRDLIFYLSHPDFDYDE